MKVKRKYGAILELEWDEVTALEREIAVISGAGPTLDNLFDQLQKLTEERVGY